MQTTNHILAKEGILTAFAIAKRVTPDDMKKMQSQVKGKKSTSSLFKSMLTKKIIEDTQQAFETNKIPGLMVKEIVDENAEKKRIVELTYFASIMAKKMTGNNISKYHSCYIINAIVNMLGLTEEDFNEFHRKFSRFKEGRPPGDDERDEPESY